ncbi:MAG TPA: histidine phosphatase family protein [Xanthobacteraceae bacterium]|nr:histidine phosphatase family protein [Xanthobacteraceae bacterium]
MALPRIYYVRHGETDWNAAGRFQGGRDIPLNEVGRTQARQAGAILKDLLARDGGDGDDIPFVASPLGRAMETMELVRGELGLPREGYALDDRLREIGYGEWEGFTTAQMQAAHPDIFARRLHDKWNVAPPGGETYAALGERVRQWLATVERDTVVVAHGGTLRGLMVVLDIEPSTKAADIYIEQGVVYVLADGRLAKFE